MKIASPKNTAHQTANDEALEKCKAALKQKDKGDFEGAQDTMRPIWKDIGERSETTGLHPSIAAEVLLTVGILTGWIGSKRQVERAQETAKNLITEGITYF